jgi:hemoglobin-like flavoprotein
MKQTKRARQKPQRKRNRIKSTESNGTLHSASLSMNTKQIQLLRLSYSRIAPQAAIAALVFYRNLFTKDPTLRPLFHSSIEVQSRKLMEALTYTIATLEDPKALVPVLEAMGRRHVGYGVRDEHYDTVIEAMMLMLEQTLAEDFKAETRDVWKTALTFVADTMKRGGEQTTFLKKSLVAN